MDQADPDLMGKLADMSEEETENVLKSNRTISLEGCATADSKWRRKSPERNQEGRP